VSLGRCSATRLPVSRVQDLNKDFGTEILITEATQAELSKSFNLRKLPPARVKGRTQSIQLYAIG